MSDLSNIAGRLGQLIRLLSSNIDAEALGAARAIIRTLNAAGHDIHALAACIEKPSGLTQEEMQKLYDASFQDGVRVAEEKFYGDSDFRNTDGKPEWGEIARWCQRQSDRLRAREGEFINSVTARCVWREPSPTQEKWLLSIFYKLGVKL